MRRLEYLLSAGLLRPLGVLFARLPLRRRLVVLATARTPVLEGNLRAIHDAMRARHPELEYRLLLEPYTYRLGGKLRYLARLVRGMYYLQRARLFVVDNAYLPVHVMRHRPETTVVQVWHAAGALKRFGVDTPNVATDPERGFLHRNYDYVVVGGESARAPYSAALRTPLDRVLALGSPRTDFFFDSEALAASRARVMERYPQLAGRRVVLYAPTFRGRGKGKRAGDGFDAERLRALLPDEFALVLKTHPNLDPSATATAGYDAVVDPTYDINELFTATDILVTDYSSSIFEWSLLHRPLVLLVDDLERYARNPGLYLDYATEMIGTQVPDTEGVARAIVDGDFDLSGYDAFIERHLGGSRGDASRRFVERFVDPWSPAVARSEAPADPAAARPHRLKTAARQDAGDRLRAHVSQD